MRSSSRASTNGCACAVRGPPKRAILTVALAQCQEERMRLESQDLMRQVQEEQRRNAEIKQVRHNSHTFLPYVNIFL
jgi:hypothetical protein